MRILDIFDITEDPVLVIGQCAGESYGRYEKSVSDRSIPFVFTEDFKRFSKRIETCFNKGHMSVFENAKVTFHIEGISRACSHQLVRHRLASITQLSQRHVPMDFVNDNTNYIIPKKIESDEELKSLFDDVVKATHDAYMKFMDNGIEAEDARYILPESTTTVMSVTCNLRELYHIFDLRLDHAAQWEIRELVNEMKELLKSYNRQWRFLIDMYDKYNNNRAR